MRRRFCSVVVWLAAVVFVGGGIAQAGVRLWALQAPDAIVEYDPVTFERLGTRHVPSEVLQSPQDLQINREGQLLFVPSTVREPDGVVHESSNSRVWFSDGASSRFLNRATPDSHTPLNGQVLVTSTRSRCFLSADGASLFWFENRIRTLQASDTGSDASVTQSLHVSQSDLSGNKRREIASHDFAPCECTTGVCSETCAEPDYGIPDKGVANYFIVTSWIPGQIQRRYEASFLYRKSADGWTKNALPHAIERTLDSSFGGRGLTLLEAVYDSGCCGWINESDDQVLLMRNGKSQVLFDEFKRYRNQDYDVSFFAVSAMFSPDSTLAAMTIKASNEASSEIRLSDSGTANEAELGGIRRALADLPMVNVVRIDERAGMATSVAHAALVGWLNDDEILLCENGVLTSYNVRNGKRRDSGIRVRDESHAFVR